MKRNIQILYEYISNVFFSCALHIVGTVLQLKQGNVWTQELFLLLGTQTVDYSLQVMFHISRGLNEFILTCFPASVLNTVGCVRHICNTKFRHTDFHMFPLRDFKVVFDMFLYQVSTLLSVRDLPVPSYIQGQLVLYLLAVCVLCVYIHFGEGCIFLCHVN
jgi:hypothetical protein